MMYKIGQLAKEAGISIRTLRYYDEMGILTPSFVSDAGYRYYNEDDIMKLHHITTLKQLGFTLGQIRNVLEAEAGGLTLKNGHTQFGCSLICSRMKSIASSCLSAGC